MIYIMAGNEPWRSYFGPALDYDKHDGRPRICDYDDRLLERLIAVHGEPRHDIPRELIGQPRHPPRTPRRYAGNYSR
jgi:hypothetical protein